MEIAEIKAALTLQKILTHYHLTPDRNARLHCPFHPDKTPLARSLPFSSECTTWFSLKSYDFIRVYRVVSRLP